MSIPAVDMDNAFTEANKQTLVVAVTANNEADTFAAVDTPAIKTPPVEDADTLLEQEDAEADTYRAQWRSPLPRVEQTRSNEAPAKAEHGTVDPSPNQIGTHCVHGDETCL